MDSAILAGVARDIEHHRALASLTSAQARPTEENHLAHQETATASDALAREAEGYLAEHQAEHPAAPPAAPRRNIPMSAPVSRDVPMTSGGRAQENNTLSVAEREIAHVSFRGIVKTRGGERVLAESPAHARDAG